MNRISTVLGISLLYIVSLIYSKAGLSISMALLLIYGLWSKRLVLRSALKGFITDKRYVGLTLVFLVYLLSGLNSDDTNQWLKQVRIKLPFLLLPLGFYLIGPLKEIERKWLHYGLAVVCIVSAIPVLLHFANNSTDLLASIGKGQYIPTPIDHIHYSIVLSYAALSLLVYNLDKKVIKTVTESILLPIGFLTLAAILHVLAVRSGIAILYLGIMYILVWSILKHKRYAMGLVGVVVLISIPLIAYKTVPSLKKKVDYMAYDYIQYKKGEGKNYSDSERIMSYIIAAELAKEKPIIGHGVGDLKALMIKKHKEKYGPKEKYIFPHNQYLYVMAGVGILGFIVFFYGLLSPYIHSQKGVLLGLIFLVMLASFMVENTVQRAVSIAFFLLFIFWNMDPVKGNDKA